MNYYQFHIGDYASSTRHLSWEEDAAYRRLLDVYYKTEKPLPCEIKAACRLVLAQTDTQREAVATVLQEFFLLTADGWINNRADAEIGTMLNKQQSQRDKANKRWHKPVQELGNATACQTDALAMPPAPAPAPAPAPKRESAVPAHPQPRERKTAVTLTDYLDACKAKKEKPVPDSHSIRTWAAEAGINPEMLQITWVMFRERYTEAEKGAGKKYKDWPGHFATAIKANWFKVWFCADAGVQWSSVGLTQKNALDARMAQREGEHA